MARIKFREKGSLIMTKKDMFRWVPVAIVVIVLGVLFDNAFTHILPKWSVIVVMWGIFALALIYGEYLNFRDDLKGRRQWEGNICPHCGEKYSDPDGGHEY
jgi:undecaprenyl pyrophosphate phosphatase UppP